MTELYSDFLATCCLWSFTGGALIGGGVLLAIAEMVYLKGRK